MPTSPPSVTALPTPPSRDDPANFPTRGDTFLAALPTFQTQHQALAANAYANALEAEADATAADASALAASNAASASAASAITAASGSGAPLWVSGTTYAALARVISPLSLLIYRRVSAGAGTLDPSIDSANWRLAAPFQLQLIRVNGTTVTASAGGRYALENAALTTLTLPAEAAPGDLIEIAVCNDRPDNEVDSNGHRIQGVMDDMRLNFKQGAISLEYISTEFGWLVERTSQRDLTPTLETPLLYPTAAPLTLYCSSEVVSRTSVNGAGDAAKQPLHSFVLPAGILGPNGRLLFEVEGSSVNAGTRQISVGYLDGSTVVDLSVELSMTSTNTNYEQTFKVYNTSMTAQKYRGSLQHNGASAAGFNTAAMDTTVDQTLVVAGRWLSATSGGTIRCEAVHVTAIYGA
jgi:hypothetical protein